MGLATGLELLHQAQIIDEFLERHMHGQGIDADHLTIAIGISHVERAIGSREILELDGSRCRIGRLCSCQ